MIVKSTWVRTITILALISPRGLNGLTEIPTSTESSANYLRNVMLELRDMNVPPSPPSVERTIGSFYFGDDEKRYLAGKRLSSDKTVPKRTSSSIQNHLLSQALMLQAVAEKNRPVTHDLLISETATNGNMYYQIPGDVLLTSQKVPEVSQITRPELNALTNVPPYRQLPKDTKNQLKLQDSRPMYYYFYPLRSLVNNVRQGNHFPPEVSVKPDEAALTDDSQKNMGNPLFVAISGFIGMAVLFMIGVLLFPRLGGIRSQFGDDENYLHITKMVGEAIDRFNCTDIEDPRTRLDERLRLLCEPVKMPKPSSVVLLTKKSALQKEAKRRRKIPEKCKIAPCKRNPVKNGLT